MNFPVPPFSGLLQDLIYSLITQGVCVGYQELPVDGTIKSLTVPKNTVYALIVCEANVATLAANKGRVVRYKQLGASNLPTTTEGIPLGDYCVTEIRGAVNLANFRAIATDALTHALKIEYYK